MKSFPLFLSSSTLKVLASILMVVDHIGLLFFPEEPMWRIIGRVSFPLFAFLIAEGYRRTSNFEKYATRLFYFAVISQIPYTLFLHASGTEGIVLNIFFTLFAGLLAIAALARLPLKYSIPLTIGIMLVAEFSHFDYGMYGVLTILASYLILVRRTPGTVTLLVLPFLQTILQAVFGIFFVQFAAVFSVPLILAYNKERGSLLPRYFFYAFYPGHLFLLWIIWSILPLV